MNKNLFLVFMLMTISSFSQVVKGKIVDESNQPLPGANIYFDGTTIATIADENGEFKLVFGSKLNSILAVSFIGYQTQFLKQLNLIKI